MRICEVSWCRNKHHAQGLCKRHYDKSNTRRGLCYVAKEEAKQGPVMTSDVSNWNKRWWTDRLAK